MRCTMKTDKNPFGVTFAMDNASEGTHAAVEKKTEKTEKVEKKPKSSDLVKIQLACIPSLENAKDDLNEVMETLTDEALRKAVNGFLDQLETIEENILALTMQGIKDTRKSRLPTEAAPAITPGMISGSEPIPEAPAGQ